MQTAHEIFARNSCVMEEIADESVQLVVTSPPYPMIELWDKLFVKLNPQIKKEIEAVFNVKVDSINTLIKLNKKIAYVKLNKNNPAIDIATKFGMI